MTMTMMNEDEDEDEDEDEEEGEGEEEEEEEDDDDDDDDGYHDAFLEMQDKKEARLRPVLELDFNVNVFVSLGCHGYSVSLSDFAWDESESPDQC